MKKDITLLTRKLATLLGTKLPLLRSLDIIASGQSNPKIKKLILKIRSNVHNGSAFANALQRHPHAFDPLFCNLIRASEQSGNLASMLDRIAHYREKNERLQRKIINALTYPLFVVFVGVLVSAILMIKVVPIFERLFDNFNATLPAFTTFIITLSNGIQAYWQGISATVLIGFLFFSICFKKSIFIKQQTDKFVLRLPFVKGIVQKAIIARSMRTLAATFSAGVPLPECLEATAATSGNHVYFLAFKTTKEALLNGQTLQESMKQTGAFTDITLEMVGIGEQSGSLESMLLKVASFYEEEVDKIVESLSTLLEPVIILMLGGIVGSLVIALYLPIFKLGEVF